MSSLRSQALEHYVTLFDSLYLPQGLALYRSMERHLCPFVLWVLCADNETYNILKKLNLSYLRILKLSELETVALKKIKMERSFREYFWTLSPFAPRFVFEADATVKRVTYLDADLWFRKHPRPIFDELDASRKHVLITDHGYAPENDQSATSGQFCVQFMTFTRDGGETVRQWWEERCIEWCFERFEDGKFGDQKYLDDWPERFGSFVHVLQDKELALAPWNATRFPYANAVFYHFQGLRILSRRQLQIGQYSLPLALKEYVYKPYSNDLKEAIKVLEKNQFTWKPQAVNVSIARLIFRKLRRFYRVYQFLSPSNLMKW